MKFFIILIFGLWFLVFGCFCIGKGDIQRDSSSFYTERKERKEGRKKEKRKKRKEGRKERKERKERKKERKKDKCAS